MLKRLWRLCPNTSTSLAKELGSRTTTRRLMSWVKMLDVSMFSMLVQFDMLGNLSTIQRLVIPYGLASSGTSRRLKVDLVSIKA